MRTVPLGEIAKIERNSIQPENIQAGTLYVGLENISGDGKFENVVTVDNGELSSSKFQFDSEHLLYGKLRPYLRKIALPSFEGICSTDIVPIRPGPEVDRRYLFFFLRQPEMVDLATIRSTGVNLPRLSPKQLVKFEIPLPPLAEQQRITAVLDTADSLRTKRRAALAKLDALLQATFLDMFGDPIANPMGWEEFLMEDVCAKISDGTHHSPPIVEEGVPYVTAKHVRNGKVVFESNPWFISQQDHEKIYSRCDPKRGDVLYIKDGVTTGMAAVNEYDFEFSMLSSLALLRVNSEVCTSTYLREWLNNPAVKRMMLQSMGGAAIRRLTLKKIKSKKILVPPIELQNRFEYKISRIEEQKKRFEQSSDYLDNLFYSLQQQAFKREL